MSNRIYRDFAMETILATAFGCEVNVQRGEGNELTCAATMVFDHSTSSSKTLPISKINLIFLLCKMNVSGCTLLVILCITYTGSEGVYMVIISPL